MGTDDGAASGGHDQHHQGVASSYLFPVLATITAMSIMAAAGASIGVWKDVNLMRQSMNFLIKTDEIQQKEFKQDMERAQQKLQDHEIRLAKGKL